jgi:hypothetical protein
VDRNPAAPAERQTFTLDDQNHATIPAFRTHGSLPIRSRTSRRRLRRTRDPGSVCPPAALTALTAPACSSAGRNRADDRNFPW